MGTRSSRIELGAALCAAACLLAGCSISNTTTKSGALGDEFDASGVKVTVLKVRRHDPELAAIKLRACNDRDDAIIPFGFSLSLDQGDSKLHYPESDYSPGFDSQRKGCGGGWVEFDVPKGARVEAVKFKYDNTGSGGVGEPGGQDERHARFTWTVG